MSPREGAPFPTRFALEHAQVGDRARYRAGGGEGGGGRLAAVGVPGRHRVGRRGASSAAAVSGLLSLPGSRATINLG